MFMTLITAALMSVPFAQQTDTTIPVQPGARLDLNGLRGEVVVRTWDRNEVRVEASSRDGVEISATRRVVKIRPRSYRGVLRSVDYRLTIPVSMDVEVGGTFLDIDIQGVEGEVRAQSMSGDVLLKGGREFIKLHSVQGIVECEGARGRISLSSTNGSVRLADAEGEIAAETINGSVSLLNVRSGAVEATTVNGEVTYDGTIRDDGYYAFSAHNGGVTVTVPPGANATVSVSTFSGGFHADFPITLTETRGGGKRFSFVLGDGSARLDLDSFGGTIRLRRR